VAGGRSQLSGGRGYASLASRSTPTSGAAASPVLARELHIRVTHPVMSRQSIRPAEGLLLGAEIAAHLLLAGIVDRVFVTSEIIGPGEDCVAGLARARVDPITAMGPSLTVQETRGHAHVARTSTSQGLCLAVTLSLVLLEKCRSLESQSASVICACVGASVCGSTAGTGCRGGVS